MITAKQMEIRSNIKEYFDKASLGEVIFVPRKDNKNVYIVSQLEYEKTKEGLMDSKISRLNAYKNVISERRTIADLPSDVAIKIMQYIVEAGKIYGSHLKQAVLYGSYARGDFREDSDIDIMFLLDIEDVDIKAYRKQISYMTYDFNTDNDMDIAPTSVNFEHFEKWQDAYPFYKNINEEGIVLYGAA